MRNADALLSVCLRCVAYIWVSHFFFALNKNNIRMGGAPAIACVIVVEGGPTYYILVDFEV